MSIGMLILAWLSLLTLFLSAVAFLLAWLFLL